MAIDFSESYPLIEWDLNNRKLDKYFFGSLNDSANGFKVMIQQDSNIVTPSYEKLYFYCEKPDNTRVYQEFAISGDYFIINLDNQVFTYKGDVRCNLQISYNSKWKTSPEFIIKVDDNNIDNSVASSSVFIALQDALNQVGTVANKLDKNGGDAKDTIISFTDSTSDTDATTGEKTSSIIGKIVKSIKSLRNKIGDTSQLPTPNTDLVSNVISVNTNKVSIANIANNTTTTASGLVLDARQGKSLQDQINTQNDNLAFKFYRVPSDVIDNVESAFRQYCIAYQLIQSQLGRRGIQTESGCQHHLD